MQIKDRIVVVTGAASGIGRALAQRFAQRGREAGGLLRPQRRGRRGGRRDRRASRSPPMSPRKPTSKHLIETVETEHGPDRPLLLQRRHRLSAAAPRSPTRRWQRIWDINVMAHVWAARHLVPRMIARGGGYLLNTASAAGLLSQIGSAPYAVTKHAAVALAEWLAITHGDQGIKVSVLCPQAVRTAMTAGNPDGVASVDGMIEPEDVAEACVRAIEAETFLVLPHPRCSSTCAARPATTTAGSAACAS
jgi:NAD(P)-dependent dehydrogenase (short-subunit alcohol dehydrogenase family)